MQAIADFAFTPSDAALRESEEFLRLFKKGQTGRFDVDRDGPSLMTMQRNVKIKMPLAEQPTPIVGAFCEAVAVDAGGITSRIIHRWPDKVGERIAA